MRRPRRLSRQEFLWVREAISQLCAAHRVSDRDEDYCAAAWAAFFAAYRRFRPISSPDFWPYAYGQIDAALRTEKELRYERVYRLLSLDAPVADDSGETFLDRLPARQGDFTNGVFFFDFLHRLPREQASVAVRMAVDRDDMEEARSALGMTDQEFSRAVDQLRVAMERYCTI